MTCADWGRGCSWTYSHFESSYISGIPHSPSRLFYSFFLGWFVSKAKDSIIVLGIWWSAPQLCPWVTRCLQVGCLGMKDLTGSWLHFWLPGLYLCTPWMAVCMYWPVDHILVLQSLSCGHNWNISWLLHSLSSLQNGRAFWVKQTDGFSLYH
jgi:hypothetical protein